MSISRTIGNHALAEIIARILEDQKITGAITDGQCVTLHDALSIVNGRAREAVEAAQERLEKRLRDA